MTFPTDAPRQSKSVGFSDSADEDDRRSDHGGGAGSSSEGGKARSPRRTQSSGNFNEHRTLPDSVSPLILRVNLLKRNCVCACVRLCGSLSSQQKNSLIDNTSMGRGSECYLGSLARSQSCECCICIRHTITDCVWAISIANTSYSL